MEIKIVIPSYRRATLVTTHKAVSGAILCVTESEEAAYRDSYPDVEIVSHPDSIIGIAMTRQWIYEKFGDVFMLDDDIAYCQRMYLTSGKKLVRVVDPDTAREIIRWAGNTAHLCGCYLFGFNKNPNPVIYQPHRPILLSGYVDGCAMGLLSGSRVSWRPDVSGSIEDFYASGLNAYYHRKAFIDMRFCFVQEETFSRPGGEAAFRTMDREREGTLFLRRTFGEVMHLKSAITGGGRTKTLNHNPYGRTMKIPF